MDFYPCRDNREAIVNKDQAGGSHVAILTEKHRSRYFPSKSTIDSKKERKAGEGGQGERQTDIILLYCKPCFKN